METPKENPRSLPQLPVLNHVTDAISFGLPSWKCAPPKKKSFSHLSKKETQVFIQVGTFKGTVSGAHTFPKEKNRGGLKKKKKKLEVGVGVEAEELWSWKKT